MKKFTILSTLMIPLAFTLLCSCSKDEHAPNSVPNVIKMRLNGREITGSSFNTDRRDLFMDFDKENMQLGIFPMTLSKGSRLTIGPSSSLKFNLYYRGTNKNYIADNTQGSGELFIEQNEVTSERVEMTDLLSGAKYYVTKYTIKMKGSFHFRGIGEAGDSVIVENGLFDATVTR